MNTTTSDNLAATKAAATHQIPAMAQQEIKNMTAEDRQRADENRRKREIPSFGDIGDAGRFGRHE